ncbi:MAG: ABC transporter permease [Candidatus Nanopelagicales bacterium]|nr:ABC transporter permease [Candidatus Nanopelagicales bacterium]MCF8538745.1 ABC transporter permease [Candidatus Nanopelagicales bacterium]MCF8550811.1 ABC transporter permease [Candidatus Nanopelagicales bacterium]
MISVRRTLLHASWEFKLNIRNGEQLLLLVVIPLTVLITLSQTSVIGGERWDVNQALASAITISLLAAGFTSLAIATAFERRSGTLITMGVTPLSRLELVLGKSVAAVYLALISVTSLVIGSLILGWRPNINFVAILPLIVLAIWSVSGWAFLLAGTLRAEAVLALANTIFVVALVLGGVIVTFDGVLGLVTTLLPPGAMHTAASFAMDYSNNGGASLITSLIVLSAWGALGTFTAAKKFRWR